MKPPGLISKKLRELEEGEAYTPTIATQTSFQRLPNLATHKPLNLVRAPCINSDSKLYNHIGCGLVGKLAGWIWVVMA